MPVGAIIGAGALAAGATVYASKKQSQSIDKAAAASQTGADKALEYQKQIRTDVTPYLDAGKGALSTLTSSPNDLMSKFYTSPDYNFRKQQGMDAVLTNKATNGLLKSGKTLKAAEGFNSDLASGEFGNWWNRQQGIADLGLRGEGVAAGVAANSSNIATGNATNQGNAAIAQGNNSASAIGSLSDIISKYGGDLYSKSTGSSFNNPSVSSPGYSDLPALA